MDRLRPIRDQLSAVPSVCGKSSEANSSCCEHLLLPHGINARSSSVHNLTAAPQCPSNHEPVSSPVFGSLLAAQKFTRHHPYLALNKAGFTQHHLHPGRMGNQHGKIHINGEHYDANKIQQVVILLRNQLEFAKVSGG